MSAPAGDPEGGSTDYPRSDRLNLLRHHVYGRPIHGSHACRRGDSPRVAARLPVVLASVALAGACVLVALALGADDERVATVGAQSEPRWHAHLPLLVRAAEPDDIQPPPTVVVTAPPPTETAVPTATDTATDVAPPPTDAPPTASATTVPTATATRSAQTGTITGRYTAQGDPLPPGYGAPGFPQVELRLLQGGDVVGEVVANAVVGEDGRFAFENPPPLPGGGVYQVWWVNDSLVGINQFVGRWFSRNIATFGDGTDVELGTMEIGDVPLTGPGNDIHFSLPVTYDWEPRDERPDEVYHWSVYKECSEDDAARFNAYRTTSLGHVGTYVLRGTPPGYRLDVSYCWYVWIDGGREGTGWSFYRWKTRWLP